MSDIIDQVVQIATESPAHQAALQCDAVRKFIQHGQIDGIWDEMINRAALFTVGQFSLPDGQPVYLAALLYGNTSIHMLLARDANGGYVKLPLDAHWGGVQIVG